MWVVRIRKALPDGAWACIVIVAFVAAINLWKLGVGLDADPVLHRAGLSQIDSPGVLPGEHTLDPNDGYTLQSLARAAADQWLDGDLPYWNRYEGVGAPLAGEMQSMALHPFVLLHRLPQGFVLAQIVTEALAGIATTFFLRRLGIGGAVSLGAGIAFACNGAFAWLSNAAANPVAYLPLLLWGVEIARDASVARRRGGWLLVALAVAGSLYAGFPETAYIDGLFVGLWCLVRLADLDRPSMYRYAAKLAAGLAAGVLLASPVLLAFVDYLSRANIGEHTGALATATLPRRSISALYMPYVYGPINAFSGNTSSGDLGVFWGRVGGYLSVVQLVLAALTIGVRRLRALQVAVLAWAVVFLAKTYGFAPVTTVANWLPGMKEMAFFRYSLPSVSMAVLVLAAFGAQRVLDERIARRQIAMCVGSIAAVLVALLLIARTETNSFVDAAHYRVYLAGSFVFAVGGVGVVGAIAWRPHLTRRSTVLGAVVAIEAAALFIVPQLSTDRMTSVDTAPVEFLRQHLGVQRFYTFGPIAPNYGSYFGIASINQNDLPVPEAWSDYIRAHLDTNADPLLFTGYSRIDPNEPSAFDEFVRNVHAFADVGTKYLVTNGDPPTTQKLVAAGLRHVFDDGRTAILELPDVAGYFHAVDDSCAVTTISWQVADVRCDRPSTLVRLELADPGWSAERNGRNATVSTHGEIFQSVEVPAGETRVTFRYAPQRSWLAWLAALAAAVWMVTCRLWPRPRSGAG